jgi:hypothetical protein
VRGRYWDLKKGRQGYPLPRNRRKTRGKEHWREVILSVSDFRWGKERSCHFHLLSEEDGEDKDSVVVKSQTKTRQSVNLCGKNKIK